MKQTMTMLSNVTSFDSTKQLALRTVSVALISIGALHLNAMAQTASKSKNPVKQPSTAAKEMPMVQVVKPPIALAYIDAATSTSDMPGMNMMGAAMQGSQAGGGLFGALKGMAKGAATPNDRGNIFGSTHNMGFGMGKFLDISVHTSKNPGLSEAKQTLPSSMLLGESLQLNAPVPEKTAPTPPMVVDESPRETSYEKPKGKISIYWGCGETVRAGQPRTLDVATASIDDYAKFFVMRGKTTKGARSEPGHPAWPNKVDDRKVPENASLVGTHHFVGNGIPDSFKFELAAAQDLMPAIELMQTKKEGSVSLEWKSLNQARGYFIAVMGGMSGRERGGDRDSGEMVLWTSSELPDFGFGLMDYQSNKDIDNWINERVILPATTTKCEVPKGIFGEQGTGMLRMIAYGSESYFAYPPRPTDPKIAWEPDWQLKLRNKSTFTSILGGVGEAGPKQKPKEDKKNKATDLLKNLFGN
ncbi:hypothetical protein H8K35_04120 [Undibacterium sp. LX40W]|uniref:Uncharacterized protein n=1 Tax=Undibacterium nitidum TaxID=2762298 RepID=A0A923KK59_9BURK|nr:MULTISPECIES: hypothetical protein [Undibacterium]MBC3880425.1 hypothetical protein [Undibacterium nitidum]MBC3890838.1 hypothetical protein [Undibacterium sp. LX40W]